jgi:glucose-6-phosphate isomerase
MASSRWQRFLRYSLRHSTLGFQFFDNTDPDGFNRVFERIGDRINQTLVIVISKSGGTKETRNGMLEVEHHFKSRSVFHLLTHLAGNDAAIMRELGQSPADDRFGISG